MFIENLKAYWEKEIRFKKPTIQCYRCQAHGHSSTNCNKKAKCVKCAGLHDSSECTKTSEEPPTYTNCRGSHPIYSQYPALLAFLAKSNAQKIQLQQNIQNSPLPQAFPFLKRLPHDETRTYANSTQAQIHAPATTRQYNSKTITTPNISCT